MSKLVNVFPNPYCHLDAEGRLAGACPMGEEVRGGESFPVRSFIAARREVESHTPQRSATQLSRSKFLWFFESEPTAVPFEGTLQAFYTERFRAGELFELPSEGVAIALDDNGKLTRMPLLKALARARMAAFDAFRAAYGTEPNVELWSKQFSADSLVEVEHLELESQRDKVRATAKAEQEKAPPAEAKVPYPLTPPAPAAAPTKN